MAPNPLLQLADPFHGTEDIVLYPTAFDRKTGSLVPDYTAMVSLSKYGVIANLQVGAGWHAVRNDTYNGVTVQTRMGIAPIQGSFEITVTTDQLDALGGALTGTDLSELYKIRPYTEKLDKFFREVVYKTQGVLADGASAVQIGRIIQANEGPLESGTYAFSELDERTFIPFSGRGEIWAVDLARTNPALVAPLTRYGKDVDKGRYITLDRCTVSDPPASNYATVRVDFSQYINVTISGLIT